MRFRGKSIRRKIGALLLVPLLSLVSLWAFATAVTANEARDLLAASSVSDSLGPPAEAVVHALQAERRQTLVRLADPRRSDARSALKQARATTDAAAGEIRTRTGRGAGDALEDPARSRLGTLLEGLEGISSLRGQADSNTLTGTRARESYNDIVRFGLDFLSALRLVEDVELDRHGRAVVGLARARELLAREDALVAGALAAGQLTETERRELNNRIAERTLTHETYLPDLPPEDRKAHENFWGSAEGRALENAEERLLSSGTDAVEAGQWQEDTTGVLKTLRELGAKAGDRYTARVEPRATAVLVRAGVAAVIGFLAVLLSLVVSLRIGRRLVRELRTLSKEARDAAEVRLPEVMRRLAEGEHVDVETEAPRLEYGRDEVGQVGQALNTLQRAAVSAAVNQSDVRRGVSDVFVNLARRNQVLLHRQLNLLDAMERRTEDADELAELFRLDHLTTRMRRHAEGLVILSGAAPARQWRKPVQLMDVVRAAVAEVEDYERIEVRRMPPLAVSGSAVADLTHLIAELLENATVFSPPHTAVQVSGERVPHGFTLEIHDRGLGLTADALREANERLSQPSDFKLSDTDRLGLFVVSRLAERHGVRVSLRESPYGGTTAVTLVPGELLTETADCLQERDPLPERPAPPALLSGPVDGPVELEAPVGPPGSRRPAGAGSGHAEPAEPGAHASLPHQPHPQQERHASPQPLPQRRRRAPVLVADHGRPVGQRAEEPAGQSGEAPAEPSGHPAEPGTTTSGLPRRVRKTESAPLSRTPPQEGDGPAPAEGHPDSGTPDSEDAPDFDADEVRTRMAALQRGWQRGRQQTDTRRGHTPPGPTP